jgi:predicted MPP superfamily phosphohydrolase
LKNQKYSGKIKILHLSDIHLGPIYQYESSQKIVNEINSLNPDIVIITGDFVDGTLKISQEMLNPFDTLTIPILYVTGNHEVMYGKEEFLKLIANTRIKHIGNSNFEYKNVNFIGADWEDDLDSIIYKNKDNNNVNVLVAHAPLKFPSDLIDSNIFLMLCGHTHSGQCFPFGLLIKKCLKNNMILNGLYSYMNSRYIYCVSGCGTSGWPVRSYFSKPRIGLITLNGNMLY